MFTLRISKNKLEDLIKKMSIPTGKNKFIFPVIAPLFEKREDNEFDFPNSGLDWIAKNNAIVAWVRAKGLNVSGITEPTRMSFFALHALDALANFDNNDTITIFSDPEKEVYLFAGGRKNQVKIPMMPISAVTGMQETFLGKIDESGVITYKGDIRPDLFAIIDVAPIQQLIKNNKQKKDEIPNIYHLIFDDRKKMIKTFVNEEIDKMIEIRADAILGNGTTQYGVSFTELMNVLNGKIKIYAIEGGPLWIEQKEIISALNLHYLISPSFKM
jgi:hypothetical protein